MMNEFHSEKELFERVLPALEARLAELYRMGYHNISIQDIWEYLSNRWRHGTDLMLSDIVGDIMKVEYDEVKSFLNDKK